MKNLHETLRCLLVLLLIAPAFLWSKENVKGKQEVIMSPATGDKVTHSLSNINNWAYWVWHDGKAALSPYGGLSGSNYPQETAKSLFADGIVWGGFVQDTNVIYPAQGDLRVGGCTYNNATQPGWWGADPQNQRSRVYRIRSDWQYLNHESVLLDAAEQNNIKVEEVTQDMTRAIIDQYAEDWQNWPVDLGAPFVDTDGDGFYTEHIDQPGIDNAAQVIWFVTNDADQSLTEDLFGSEPIDLEIQTTIWSYTSGHFADMVFKRYLLINKSDYAVDSMYIAQWSDPDIGDYADDLVGCDTDLEMGFAYNGFDEDAVFSQFGTTPPAVGYRLIAGPHVYTGNQQDTAIFNFIKNPGYKNLKLNSFSYLVPTEPHLGSYEKLLTWYNILRGFMPTTDIDNPQSYRQGSGMDEGKPTKFPLNGDPYDDPYGVYGDVDGQGKNLLPGERRMILSTGPFNLQPGEKQEVIWALGGAVGKTNLHSVQMLKHTLNHPASAIFDFSLPYGALYRFDRKFPDSSTTVLEIAVQIKNKNHLSVPILEFKSLSDKKSDFKLELFNDGNHGDLDAGDDIWGNITNIRNRKYPYHVNLLIVNGQDTIRNKVLHRITLRKSPIIKNYRVVWENGRQDHFINHNEKIHIAFNIQNSDHINGINEIEIFQDTETGQEFSTTIYPADLLDDGSVYLTMIAPSSGDSVLVRYNFIFDDNIKEVSVNLPLVEWDTPPAWGDTLDVVNIKRPKFLNVLPVIADPSIITGHQYEITFGRNNASELVWNLKDLNTEEVKLSEQFLPESPEVDYPVVDGIEWKVFNPVKGIRAIVEEDADGNILDPNVSIEIPGYLGISTGTTGYIVSNRAGQVNLFHDYERDFDRFDFWECDDFEINFRSSSLTWDYLTEEVHFSSEDGSPTYAPFAVYRHKAETREKIRLFAGYWDSDGNGVWNMPLDENGDYEWQCPVTDAGAYEPIYCWQGYDVYGNEKNYDPVLNGGYIFDNSLFKSARTTWGSSYGDINYPIVTATLFSMYLSDATLPFGNKVMFYTNKIFDVEDTLHVQAVVNLETDQGNPITDFRLSQNYPNPFNPTTNIDLSLPHSTEIKLEVFNVLGQKVKTLVDKRLAAGKHTFQWDGTNEQKRLLASGIYFYKLKTKSFTQCKKMLFLK